MAGLQSALQRQRMILSLVLLLSVAGLAAWFGMNRQEDPAFPYRGGFLQVSWPGADVDQLQRLVVEPLEEEITEVEQIKEIRTTIRSGFVILILELKDTVYDTDTAWDRVRTAVAAARSRFPQGVQEPLLDDRQTDASTVVLALTGSDDLVQLQAAADRLKKRLYTLGEVARTRVYGDSGEQVSIRYHIEQAQTLNLSPADLAAQLDQRNQVIPAGHLERGDRQLLLLPQTEFTSLEQIRQTQILLPSGQSVPLQSIADVSLEATQPATELAWVNGRPAVAVALIVSDNVINVVDFGERLQRFVDKLRPEFAPLNIETLFFQPQRVQDRLAELGFSLLLGVLIVAILLLLVMGLRMGLVVALIIPLVAMSSLAVYAIGGGVMHQMSMAGMVIALGMLVDNAIVMVENIQWHLDRGASRLEAATVSVRELAAPLGAATGTTLAVFIPMLISKGNTADFTRAIPVMIILMLSISYLYALLVSPMISSFVLNRRHRGGARTRMTQVGVKIGAVAVRQGVWVVTAAALLVLGSVFLGRFLDRDFFPDTDRNQLVVDISFPEGTPITTTAALVNRLAWGARGLPKVENVYSFAGASGPRFYYNLAEKPRSPHVGRIVVQAQQAVDLGPIHDWFRQRALEWPQAQIVGRRLAQGPPTTAPVEITVTAQDRNQLQQAAERVTAILRSIPQTIDVRQDQGVGIPSLQFQVLDPVAEAAGLSRVRIAQTLAMQAQGLVVGQYRAGDDPVPIRMITPDGQADQANLASVPAFTTAGGNRPLGQVTQQRLEWQPAVLHHHNLQPAINVLAEVVEGATYAPVYRQLSAQIEALQWPPGVEFHIGGLQESSGEANTALYRTLPVGIGLLLLFLLWQFNSFRRVGIVLITVPLAVSGIIPGLLLSGYSFGFMALLGVVTLVGIVVNNAIVLVDVIDRNLGLGLSKGEAVIEAVGRRTRPILLTTMTTVAGLLPLAITSSTLWPPMAWSIISGLLASTVLTLGVVPALCYWLLSAPETNTA